MHTKDILNQDEVMSAIEILERQIIEIGNYPDKSLFFQDPRVFEGWIVLARAIEKIEVWSEKLNDTKWEDRTESYVSYLLTLREYYSKYENLYKAYYNQIKSLLDGYGSWMEGDCIMTEQIKVLLADQYEQDMEDVEDLNQFISELNENSHKARFSQYDTLSDVFRLLMAIMNRGGQKIKDQNPSDDSFVEAIKDDLREWTNAFGQQTFKNMKEELNRHYKTYRTAPFTPELWGELLSADENALRMAMRQELASCEDVKQEHWGEDMKKQMDENRKLMSFVYSSCRTDELFDLKTVDDLHQFISLLTPDNLETFYDIILRRNLIQCEMFPELKKQHEEWLNENDELTYEGEETNEELNYYAPTIHLQKFLQQGWLEEVRTDNKYDATWTDSFVSALMTSESKDGIATDWAVSGAKNKRNQIRGYIVGLLKDNGVIKGSYDSIAKKIGIMDEYRNFSSYMGKGKKQPYADWVREYINGIEVAE